MNAITRTETVLLFPLPELRMCFLVLAIFATLLGIIYFKDVNRRLFINYQESQQLTSQLSTDYAKLLLEKSAWARQARVQVVAEQRLAMEVPSQEQVVMMKL